MIVFFLIWEKQCGFLKNSSDISDRILIEFIKGCLIPVIYFTEIQNTIQKTKKDLIKISSEVSDRILTDFFNYFSKVMTETFPEFPKG